jgi:hypothetical protein
MFIILLNISYIRNKKALPPATPSQSANSSASRLAVALPGVNVPWEGE